MQAINDTIEGNDNLRKIKEWITVNPVRAAIVAVVAIIAIIAVIVIIVLAAKNNSDSSSGEPSHSSLSLSPSPSFGASHSPSATRRSGTLSPSSLRSNMSRYSNLSSPSYSPNITINSNSTSINITTPGMISYYHNYSQPCGGKGLLFPDSSGVCECFLDCWVGGNNCSGTSTNCTVSAKNEESVGVFEDYWVSRSNNFIPPFIAPDYRLPYQDDLRILSPTSKNGLSRNLFSAITYIHNMVGNANMTGRSIIIGNTGRNSLIIAALSALYSARGNTTVTLFSRAPYQRDYPKICANTQALCNFVSDPSAVMNSSNVFELITAPNNPTGRTDANITSPLFTSNAIYGIDANDNWPTWNWGQNSSSSGNSNNSMWSTVYANAPIVIFSSSKSHGFESGRFAWALVNTAVASNLLSDMRNHISALYVLGSASSMYRELYAMQYLNQTTEIWSMTASVVQSRWAQVLTMFNNPTVVSNGWSLTSQPGSCYLWIKCPPSMTGPQCSAAFESRSLLGYPGSDFGISGPNVPAYYRLSISVRSVVWPVFTNVLAQVLGISGSTSTGVPANSAASASTISASSAVGSAAPSVTPPPDK